MLGRGRRGVGVNQKKICWEEFLFRGDASRRVPKKTKKKLDNTGIVMDVANRLEEEKDNYKVFYLPSNQSAFFFF